MDFVAAAHRLDLRVWLFGSALTSSTPNDLDVLVMYDDRRAVIQLRTQDWWWDFVPPLDIIAMTADEESNYQFIAECRAIEIT